jgi:glycosyltransferase involved in cell wall biosynthesis
VDPEEWDVAPSQGYALWVGRLISRKGPHAAAHIANSAGLKLIMAGGGVAHQEPGKIVATDGTVITGNVEHVGGVTGDARKRLFAEAEVFICPTLYIGPWEGVHAEAMMSGVGVVAPDYGVFTETLPTPYRYRNSQQAVDAVNLARQTRGEVWRKRAIEMFGIEVCASMYDDWLNRLMSLRDGRNGWYG